MQSVPHTVSEKKALVRAWRASGLSAAEFGANHDIPASRLRSWASRHCGRRRAPSTESPPFVEIEARRPSAPSRLELSLGDGRILAFDATVAPAELAAFLAVITA